MDAMDADNPFPGLRPFDADESHLFFGREKATDDLLGRLRTTRFIAVVGTSGSGKSSLVRAGMLPDLYGGFMAGAGSHWRVAIFRPHDRPIHELAVALAATAVLGAGEDDQVLRVAITETVLRRGALGLVDVVQQARLPAKTNLLVVVDQFEELFRLRTATAGRDAEDEAAAFVKLLLEAVQQSELPIYVMLTMRSEYLGDCTRFRDLPEAINDGQYLIPRMTRDQRRQAIVGPVAVGGATIAPPLVQRLLNDVGDNPDQLPIMQHAMMRTWSIWASAGDPSQPIDLSHYEATGGMGEALSRHADEAYQQLPDDANRAIAARIFKRLTGRGTDNREMRYPASLAELCALTGAEREQVVAVIDAFRHGGRSFLMPPPNVPLQDDSLIDISHESLIRIWKRLGRWVEEESVSARTYTRLAETSELHRAGRAGLWRDPDLQIALSWRARTKPNKVWAARFPGDFKEAMGFLDASIAAARRRQLAIVFVPVAVAAAVIALGYFRLLDELAMLDDNVALFQEQAELAQQEAAAAQGSVAAAKEELQQTQAAIQAAREALVEAQSAETAQASTTRLARHELERQIAELSRDLEQTRAPGGDESRKEGLQLALVAAAAQIQTLDSVTPGPEGQVVAATAARVEGLQKIEEQLAASVEKLQELETTTPAETAPAAPSEDMPATGGEHTDVAALEGKSPPSPIAGEGSSAEPPATAPVPPASPQTVEPGAASATSVAVIDGADAGSVAADGIGTAAQAATPSCASAAASELHAPLYQRLAAWRECLEQSQVDAEKAAAEQRIARLEELVGSSAFIDSAESFLTCQEVRRLECQGATDSFTPGKVHVFARVRSPIDASLRLDWLQEGTVLRSGTLKVKQNTGAGFRTFSWRTISEPGQYEVRLYNGRDELIGTRPFSVR